MPETSVDAAVEKLLTEKPAETTPQETPSAEAPAKTTPGKEAQEEQVPDEGDKGANGLTAFEQELVTEFQEEYDSAGDKKAFLSALKRSYRKQAKQMTELGSLRKAVKALRDAGVTGEDLLSLIRKRQGKTEAPPASANGKEASESKRGFQRYEDQVEDPKELKNLKEARTVLREEWDDWLREFREKEVKPLQERLSAYEQDQLSERSRTLDAEIDALEDSLGYPGSLVETYRDVLKREGLRFPKLSAEELLIRLAPLKDIKVAMAKLAAAPPAEEKGKPKSALNAPIVKKATPEALPHDRHGRVSISNALDFLLKSKPKGK